MAAIKAVCRSLALASVLFMLAGCGWWHQIWAGGGLSAADKAKQLAGQAADRAIELGYLGFIAFVCIAGGIAAIIASMFLPIIPRKAAIMAIACGVGVHLLKAFLAKFETALLWGAFGLVVIGCAAMLWPMLVAAHRGTLLLKARQLLKSGHLAEAVAFTATAKQLDSPKRKALLANLKATP